MYLLSAIVCCVLLFGVAYFCWWRMRYELATAVSYEPNEPTPSTWRLDYMTFQSLYMRATLNGSCEHATLVGGRYVLHVYHCDRRLSDDWYAYTANLSNQLVEEHLFALREHIQFARMSPCCRMQLLAEWSMQCRDA